MPVHNADIAAQFERLADLLEIQGANPFRVRAYRNAARTLESLGREVGDLPETEDLSRFPGIGKDLAGKIREIVETGRCSALMALERELPPALTDLLDIPGLGPKKVSALYRELDVRTSDDLFAAARQGRISALPGFGSKTEQRVLEALRVRRGQQAQRFKLAVAAQYGEALAGHLRALDGVDRVVIAGSYRRGRDTVGDLDILVTTALGTPVMDAFVGYSEVAEVLAHGPTRATVVLACGLQVDLRVVAPESFGAALHYFTGSKAHNIAVRRLGQQHGLKINEYGVFRDQERIAGATEESVFAAVGLPFIPPELREDRGEVQAAAQGRLPALVALEDLRGDLHVHTKATDGRHSLREMAEGARARGLSYIAITDHSQRVTVAHGLDAGRLLAQIDEIDRLNAELKGITLLKGLEVDILEDGSLDMEDQVLNRLDVVIGAVHSRFNLSREAQTARILRALDHPCLTMLAHPSGRLIGEREPYDMDVEQVIRHAARRGRFLELNAQPARLDLWDVHCRMARDAGVLVSINSDAHSVADFDNLRYGIGQARRGWLSKGDVLNTRALPELRKLLARARGK